MKKKSSKRSKLDNQYLKQRKAYFLKPGNSICKARLPGCSLRATDIHHRKGRLGTNLLDTSTWLPLCRSCHNWIEIHPEEAKLLGFSENRL